MANTLGERNQSLEDLNPTMPHGYVARLLRQQDAAHERSEKRTFFFTSLFAFFAFGFFFFGFFARTFTERFDESVGALPKHSFENPSEFPAKE